MKDPMRKALVTGAAGFIGRHLSAALTERGVGVHKLDKTQTDATCLHCDVLNPDDLREHLRWFRPDTVFHLAAQTEVGKSFEDPCQTYQTNVVGTLNVLEACRKCGVESVVVASSDKAYGVSGYYTEDTPLQVGPDPYSNSKRLADELAQVYEQVHSLPVKILRPCNTYGPGQLNQTTLITGTVARVLRGERPVVHGNPLLCTTREWMHVDDAVEAYLLAAEIDRGVFNVGSGSICSVLDVVQMILSAMDKPTDWYELRSAPPWIRDQGLDSSKFHTYFPNWHPRSLDEGLPSTIDWYVRQWGKAVAW